MINIYNKLAQIIDEELINIPKPDDGLISERVTIGLQIVFGIAAAVAVLIIAISALKIVISRGNSQDVQKARDSIIYAVVGLIITMSAFVIVTFVLERI
jgi:hypothetical protein